MLTCGAIATAIGLVGTAASESADSNGSGRSEVVDVAQVVDGAMYAYQCVPDSRVTVLERGLDRRPSTLDSTYEAAAVRYEHARSLRALVFANGGLPPEVDSFAIERSRSRSPVSRSNLVGIDLSIDR